MPTQRYKLTIGYRGTNYHGWQTQAANEFWKGPKPKPGHGIPTVQENVKRAIESVVGHPIGLVGSSRTDTGVHAKAQLAHFDTDRVQIPAQNIVDAANHRLPDDILIKAIEPVPDTFDAISSTVSKRYQYFIWNNESRPIFFPDLVWHRIVILDAAAMREAAQYFVGEHDFASFARPRQTRENTIRTIYNCDVSCRLPRMVIGIEGNGFMWNMIRIIIGTLVEVGMKHYPPKRVKEMLEARDRRAAGPTAPPQGLFLQWIKTV
ncbi:MAG TPA: tRNA pseudouridine(38-40) synthase TruA [Tepidisphaeraceae bacterium]|nr:tRNA pseudouridine(38-40) synthase TruA [Tepidisphaeraceae bacterium]